MDPNYEDLALLRAHEPGVLTPARRVSTRAVRDHRARRHLASTLRRMANRLDA